MGSRRVEVFHAAWDELCRADGYRGRWVALDNVVYGAGSTTPVEADVVDVDDDLAALCSRMRATERTSLCVVQCNPRRASAPPVNARAR